MFDSRSPWYSGGHSRTDLDAGSSVSLLQSIYGSQVSQLPFSDYDSDVDLLATKSDYLPSNRRSSSPALPQRRLARPKSSPASVIEARERQRRHQQLAPSDVDGYGVVESAARVAVRRPGSAMLRQRPGTASGRTRIARGRPVSAAGSRTQRPSSAAPSHFVGGGGASPKRSRPKTAMGLVSTFFLCVSLRTLILANRYFVRMRIKTLYIDIACSAHPHQQCSLTLRKRRTRKESQLLL